MNVIGKSINNQNIKRGDSEAIVVDVRSTAQL
jgi:hypothetical protein